MALVLKTAPTVYPVSRTEVKEHLRLDSVDMDDDLTIVQSIPPGAHAAATNYSLVGTAVDVLGYQSMVVFEAATIGTNASVNVKLQDSDDNVTYVDVTSGAFTGVTPSNDNATYQKIYTGGKQYLRPVATVATASCDFAVSVVKESPVSAEDNLLDGLIEAATEAIENFLGRKLITQTWYYYRDGWPGGSFFDIPYPPLQSVSALTYKNTSGTAASLTVTTDYIVETANTPGQIHLAYGKSWPGTTLYPTNPIRVEYVCGYGATSASVPEIIRRMMLVTIAYWYENRESGNYDLPLMVKRALQGWRAWPTSQK